MTIAFTRLEDDQWDALVDSSPQGSPFNRTELLDALGTQSIRWGALDGTTVLAGAAVQLDNGNVPIGPPRTFGYCQGVLLAPQVQTLPAHSRSRKELDITRTLVEGLTAEYRAVWLGLHWGLRDLRSFQWINYHQPYAGQFQIALRYTGILDLAPFATVDAYVSSLGKGRRGDYTKARNSGIVIRASDDIDVLDRLHRLTFSSQGAQRGSLEHQLRPMMLAALQNGFGEQLVAYTPSGEPISASFFVWNRTTSHYLFGASDPACRDTGAATLIMVENISRAMQRGNRDIDFVGINSPQRGGFKTSFNAIPVPYFDVHWHRPD